MTPSDAPRLVRDLRDDEANGPAGLERLLALVTVAMLAVLVTSTVGQGLLVFLRGVSARLGAY
jgi:Flp pilus assembly pilin Flp